MLLFRGGPVLALFLFGVCCTTMVSPENGAARTVKFSVDSLGDPADFFASALAYDDGNEDDGGRADDGSGEGGGHGEPGADAAVSTEAFTELPPSVKDSLHFAFSQSSVLDEVQFFLSLDGKLVERRYNKVKFVYRLERMPEGVVGVALTPIYSVGQVLVTSTTGKVFLRHSVYPAGDIAWTDVTMPGHYIVGGGQFYQHGENGKVLCYFVSAQGSLLEYNTLPIVTVGKNQQSHRFTSADDFRRKENWKNLGHPRDGGLVGVSAVFYTSAGRKVIACVNALGQVVLFENQRWKTVVGPATVDPGNLLPSGQGSGGDDDDDDGPRQGERLRILPLPAATVTPVTHENAPSIMMVLGADGRVYGVVKVGREWVLEYHECFYGKAVVHFVSAPSKALVRNSAVSVFFVSASGRLFERTLDLKVQSRWKWIDHGHPGGHLLAAAPPLVSHGAELICRTRAGDVAKLVLWGFVWRWNVDRPPAILRYTTNAGGEGDGAGKFCDRDLVSVDDCYHGFDPMGVMPVPKVEDAYEAVTQAKTNDPSLFNMKELRVNGVKVTTDCPLISYTVDPDDADSPNFDNSNLGNRVLPATMIVARTAQLFAPETVAVRWSAPANASYAPPASGAPDVEALLALGGLAMSSSAAATPGSRAAFAMARMTENSIFIVSPGGLVFERFWNQAHWVYVRHRGLPPEPAVQLTTISHGGTLFASTLKGGLYQRIASGYSKPLTWKRLIHRGSKFFQGGVVSAIDNGKVYFLDHTGKLLIRHIQQQRWQKAFKDAEEMWVKDPQHRSYSLPRKKQNILYAGTTVRKGGQMVKLAVLISADDLTPGLFFALDVNAELWEYSTWLSRWVWHGRPDDAFLAIQPAAVLPDSNAVGSLFFRTTDGRVFERYFNQFRKSWMWVDHGSPIVAKLAGPPGAVLFNNRIHFVGTDGHLWALVFRSNDETGDGWKWTDCGIPGVPLAIMRPVRISTAGVGILTVDGKLAERTWSAKLELWKWRTNELPEGSALGSPPGTKYCSPEPMSPLNCVRAAKSTGHLDLVNPNKQVLRQLQQNLEQKVIEMEGAVSPEGRSFVEGGNADQSGKRKKKKKKNRAGKKGSGTSKKKKGSTLARDALAKSDGGMT